MSPLPAVLLQSFFRSGGLGHQYHIRLRGNNHIEPLAEHRMIFNGHDADLFRSRHVLLG